MATSQFKTILLFSIFLLVTHHNSFASKNLVEVEGEYTYYIPYNVSRDKAEQTAMQRAMVAALAKEFGTLVSEISHLDMKSSKDSENVDFWSSASTLVKGEWIETIGRPIFTPSIENGDFVMTCKIRGKAREIKMSGAELDIHLLANSTDPNSETSSFMDGDKIFLQFTSPTDGYLAVYLEGEDGNVMRMLPFTDERINSTKIEANKRYFFFVSTDGDAEQYQLNTDKPIERNNILIVFSPNEYVKPIDYSPQEEMELRQLSSKAFRSWVTKLRGADSNLQFIIKPITISGRID
ncbi:DUF4384 domain-containing protein [Lepagella muris]|uniref:DUF4384 domain-containing protein n=1 Tax=Lepagella muris TaxID=3032870 RepID=A0AC61RFQ1_9BACT|nr:DUF4384 domain-containing protein [Lepagella muris]ROT05384.1 DUF4384 domain-containing protein [Muribaculaceae bacterium Isolate-037 (Harlan)]TGY75971.1 DUF4384 domain-containing protein [Lepagella muris]THG46426.1 DUF4384 domain-containing protein [Bacteroidales bacterium]TKC58273.1 DUF4384 domain-containing protein [Bacteroidales bacterium]